MITDPLLGQTIGNYQIYSRLGKGGMATVYRARQVNMQRDVAIKIMSADLAQDPQFVARFEQEARVIANLQHPRILPVHDFGHEGETFYLVMRLIEGESLYHRLLQGALPLLKASKYLGQIAEALDYAHAQGVIHRDLKPNNVLIDEWDNLYLMDFGLAKMLAATQSLTQTGTVLGTPTYMAPEQWRGGAVDARTDGYALGVIVYEMVLGRTPFESDTPFTLMYKHLNETPPPLHMALPDLPQAVEDVIFQALAKEPEKRYASAGALALAFAEVVRVAGSLVAKARLETALQKTDAPPATPATRLEPEAPAEPSDKEAQAQLTISDSAPPEFVWAVDAESQSEVPAKPGAAEVAAEVIEAPAEPPVEESQPVIAPAESVGALLAAPAAEESQPQIAAVVEEKSPEPSGEELQPGMPASEPPLTESVGALPAAPSSEPSSPIQEIGGIMMETPPVLPPGEIIPPPPHIMPPPPPIPLPGAAPRRANVPAAPRARAHKSEPPAVRDLVDRVASSAALHQVLDVVDQSVDAAVEKVAQSVTPPSSNPALGVTAPRSAVPVNAPAFDKVRAVLPPEEPVIGVLDVRGTPNWQTAKRLLVGGVALFLLGGITGAGFLTLLGLGMLAYVGYGGYRMWHGDSGRYYLGFTPQRVVLLPRDSYNTPQPDQAVLAAWSEIERLRLSHRYVLLDAPLDDEKTLHFGGMLTLEGDGGLGEQTVWLPDSAITGLISERGFDVRQD